MQIPSRFFFFSQMAIQHIRLLKCIKGSLNSLKDRFLGLNSHIERLDMFRLRNTQICQRRG